MDILKHLEENKVILFIVDSSRYNDAVIETLKSLPNDGNLVYITLNKTASSLENFLKDKSIEFKNLIIVDCITRTIRDVRDKDDIIYIDSPKALSDLSFVLSGILSKRKKGYIILDSLTTLLVYQDKPIVARFILNMANKIRESRFKSVIFAADVNEHKDFLKEIGIFVDKVVKG